MKWRPIVLLALLVIVPVGLLAVLGLRAVRDERDVIEKRMRTLLTERLHDVDRTISIHFDALERDLEQLTAIDQYDQRTLRQMTREDPRLLQLFVVDYDGELVHPNRNAPLNRYEQDFLEQASRIISDHELNRAADLEGDVAGVNVTPSVKKPTKVSMTSSRSFSRTSQAAQRPQAKVVSGWLVWYWGRGMNLIYWQQRPNGHIVAAALDRSRWMADIIAVLPDTAMEGVTDELDGSAAESQVRAIPSRTQLVDAQSHLVYQWKNGSIPNDVEAVSDIPLSAPLSAWRLQHFVPPEQLSAGTGFGSQFNLLSGLLLVTVGLITMAIVFYREYARDMREASQRVSFVNQVSHELRTPLTNIWMYSDLLESDLDVMDENVEKPRGRLRVIQTESTRLNRLIDNVLAFARQQRKTLRIDMQAAVVDGVIGQLLVRLQPSLDQFEIETKFVEGAPEKVKLDVDALEQILCNLISNVEKYAFSGKELQIQSEQRPGWTVIRVADRGPGIEPSVQARIFEPFWRASEHLSATAGTGIGLSIARQLSRLHGGDLQLVESSGRGTTFELRLKTEPALESDT